MDYSKEFKITHGDIRGVSGYDLSEELCSLVMIRLHDDEWLGQQIFEAIENNIQELGINALKLSKTTKNNKQ